ncbi:MULTISPECIES: transposase [Methylobacterium]|uniref:transposase n=1 Tax=Methylobacterium TaxID=407 RepID=UPI003756E4C1
MVITPPVGEAVGGDLGVEALLTLSTGERIPNVRPASRREREIRVSRRALARCRKGSNRRRRSRRGWRGSFAPWPTPATSISTASRRGWRASTRSSCWRTCASGT